MKIILQSWNQNMFYTLILNLSIVTIMSLIVDAQRIAPGVPPQHYQPPSQQYQHQQVPQQQYGQAQYQQVPVQQQVPIQHQQIPVQHHQQQVPVQHQQQQVPVQHQQQQLPVQQQIPVQQHVPAQQHQQVPAQQHQHGHDHGRQQQLLNAANVAQEAQHIAEHMDVPMDTSKMSEQELQFHYFKMHDADNNNKLDGCELIKSLIHWHEQGNKEKPDTVEEKVFRDEELVNLIDPILNVDDFNKDGYIDYPEFIRAQQKAAGQAKPQA